ncbi:hypothetical protein, partial [Sinorhizobium meliloti]|uniref:hypothetical protein n=1 Tax=Rhizobium meliloti TaxID=382 RepID=UPI001AEC8994
GFSPGHRDLHRIFANPTESQLAEITQFFLRQPLRWAAWCRLPLDMMNVIGRVIRRKAALCNWL